MIALTHQVTRINGNGFCHALVTLLDSFVACLMYGGDVCVDGSLPIEVYWCTIQEKCTKTRTLKSQGFPVA